jgi:hypothetical protein
MLAASICWHTLLYWKGKETAFFESIFTPNNPWSEGFYLLQQEVRRFLSPNRERFLVVNLRIYCFPGNYFLFQFFFRLFPSSIGLTASYGGEASPLPKEYYRLRFSALVAVGAGFVFVRKASSSRNQFRPHHDCRQTSLLVDLIDCLTYIQFLTMTSAFYS